MPNKKLILIFLAGWALSIVFPPTRLFGMFGKKS